MKEVILPNDSKPHTHILIKHEVPDEKPKYYFRYGDIDIMHAELAEVFILGELGLGEEEIENSNYLHKEVLGYTVIGAGEFKLSGNVFIHRPSSVSYNGFCFLDLSPLMTERGFSVQQTVEDLDSV